MSKNKEVKVFQIQHIVQRVEDSERIIFEKNEDYKLILGVLTFIVGWWVGTVLVMMTENYVYLIINAVTGFVGVALIGYAFQEDLAQ